MKSALSSTSPASKYVPLELSKEPYSLPSLVTNRFSSSSNFSAPVSLSTPAARGGPSTRRGRGATAETTPTAAPHLEPRRGDRGRAAAPPRRRRGGDVDQAHFENATTRTVRGGAAVATSTRPISKRGDDADGPRRRRGGDVD